MNEATPTGPDVDGYAVTGLLGRGATSAVWAATDGDTGDPVAVKITDPAAQRAVDVLALAARESAVLSRVADEHVVRMRRAFARPDGSVAVVTDLAQGGSLANLVAARGRLTEGEVATVLVPLATTLDTLHRAGVVHGDLSPGNVLFTAAGKPLLADFATARAVGESEPPLVAGTPGFLAPERADGGLATEPGDVFGLGALAWYALTGRPLPDTGPPEGVEMTGMVGAAYAPVVSRLLAADPIDRPTAGEAARELYAASPPVPVRLVAPGGADVAAALTRRLRAQAVAVLADPPRRRRVPFWRRASRGRHAVPSKSPSRIPLPWRRIGRLPRSRRGRWAVVSALLVAAMSGVLVRTIHARLAQTPDPTPVTAQVETQARALLRDLAAARARALMVADPGLLEQADAPESPILEHDTRLIATIRASSARYASLRFDVVSVRDVRVTPPTATVVAQLDTVLTTTTATAASASDGDPGVPSEEAPLLVELRLVEGRWLLADLRSP